jgi:SAM-dependent methyltransferase
MEKRLSRFRALNDLFSKKFRERRMKLFSHLTSRIPKPATLLDVGGTVDFWHGRIPEGCSVTMINLFDQQPTEGIEVLIGDGCDLSRFENNSFDCVFSNSVLCLVGEQARQNEMAREVRRVGRRYFVQTPNQNFPLDWRTLVPFFHWLPPSVQAWCFQRMPVGRYKKVHDARTALEMATRVRDVTRSELRSLFPEATIVSERVFGITKSFMVHHGFE